ncbi:MAG: MBL fold metallo-hydrolase [Paraclostridium sp.]
MGKKQKEKVSVDFIGKSKDGVTGSCILITYPKKNGEVGKFLLECGSKQLNGRLLEEYKENKEIIDSVPKDVEYIFVAHAHGDHSLNIPGVFNKRIIPKVITTEGNKAIMNCILKDGAFILARNTQALQKKGYKLQPLYTESDVDISMHNTETYGTNQIHKLNEYISFRFTNNSHVIFATQLEIFITMPSGRVRKIFYSSDLGSNKNFNHRYFLKQTEIVSKSNIAIFEATYSDVNRGFTKEDAFKERVSMIRTIKAQLKNKNKVIIPSFAFARSQELLCFLYDNLKGSKAMEESIIVLDGKLVHDINNVYLKHLEGAEREYFKQVLNWDKLHIVKDYTESVNMANKKDTGMIVIAGSGMGNIGRIQNFIKSSIERKNDMIMFVGYCAKGTIGDNIKNSNIRTVKIDGLEYNKLCKVKVYNTWSSHIQSDELINYFKQINAERIVLHHSDQEYKYQFADNAKEELYKIGKTTRVSVADKNNSKFII